MRKYLIPALCLLNILIHLSAIFYMEFHRDELLYFSLINHLDWGYASVPPLISWMAWLADAIFGFSPFAVKIFPALLSGAMVYLATQIAKELGGGFYAQLLTAVAFMCTPLSLRAFILFQPVPFDIFFWTLIFYLILKFVNSDQDKWLYWMGASIGIAVMNKYLILFLLAVLFLVLPFTRYRTLFSRKAFYLGILLAALIASPNIIWQITNDFPVLTHMAELERNQLQNVTKMDFLSGQILMLLSSVIIAVIGLVWLLRRPKYRIFGWSIMGVFALLLFMQAKDYYVAGIHPFLIAAGSVAISSFSTNRAVRSGILFVPILVILPLLPFGIPFMKPAQLARYFDRLETMGLDIGRIHEDGEKHRLPQDFADMMGWYDIAAYAKQAYDLVEDKSTVAIFGENYGIAGAVTLINQKYGMPEAISFSDTYEYWAPEQFDPEIQTLIYINDNLGSNVEALFDDIRIIGTIDDPLSRQYGTTIYLCQQPNRSFNEFWAEVWEYVRAN